jgi:DNA-binding response OmpR family regulator
MSYLLVIEDDADTRALLRMALRKQNFTVTSFGSAAEALRHLRENPPPDLILLDLTLPDMSGDEFMKVLRADDKISHLKVMICSGWDNLDERSKLIGADAYLPKPFEIGTLGAKLAPYFA